MTTPGQPFGSDEEKRDINLDIDPELAAFSTNGGYSEHMLVNLGEKRLAIKVKCSDIDLFRVDPVFMFIDPGECKNLIIRRFKSTGALKNDKLVFHHMCCEPSDTDIQALFKRMGNSTTVQKLTLSMKCYPPGHSPP